MRDTLPPLLDAARLDLRDDQDLLVGIALWAEGEGTLAEALAAAIRGRSPAAVTALVERAHGSGMDLNAFTQALLLLVPPDPADAPTWRAVAAARVPAPPAVLYNLALDLRTAVMAPDAALPLYQRVVAADPADADAWLDLGNCLEDLGQVEPALDAWARAARVDPRAAGPWLNRAGLLAQLGRVEPAREALAHALRRDPSLAAQVGDDPELGPLLGS